MSAYGKIWAQIAEIRNELKRLCPTMNTDRLELARAHVALIRSPSVDRLLARWGELEAEAKGLPE